MGLIFSIKRLNCGIDFTNCVAVLLAKPLIAVICITFSSSDKSDVNMVGCASKIAFIVFSANPCPNILDADASCAKLAFLTCVLIEL